MSKRNYTQYSKQPAVVDETPVTIEEEVKAVEVKMEPIETPVVEAPVAETPVVEAPKPQPVTGVVANCSKLNVRAKADASASVVCVLNVGAAVTIDVKRSNKEWFKVRTESGVDGFCMRKFINASL